MDTGWPEFDNLTSEEQLKLVELLFKNAWKCEVIMSDTFAFACADSETIDTDDFLMMAPIFLKYGHHAFTALASLQRNGEEPITCRCNHNGPEFVEARTAMQKLIDDGSLTIKLNPNYRKARERNEDNG